MKGPMIGRVVIGVSLLVVAGCGGGGDTCETLVDSAVELVQDAIDELDRMSVDDLAAAEDDGPEAFRRLETEGAALEARAAELGCTSAEVADLLADRVDRLEASSDYGQAIIESIRAGRVVFSGG